MASGQLRLFALITLFVANVAPSLSMGHDIPQIVRRNPPTMPAEAWSQVNQLGFFDRMRTNYYEATTNLSCVCPFWSVGPHFSQIGGERIAIKGSSMPEEVCHLLRLGKHCDPKTPDSIEKTNIIVTGFAPVRTWGVCRPPEPKKPPGLCYYWDRDPQEVQREIRCWMNQRFPAAQGPSVIPMVPVTVFANTGYQYLNVEFQPARGHTNSMNAGGSHGTHTGGSSQAEGSTESTQTERGAHGVGILNQDLQRIREQLHTESCGPRSTVCPSIRGDNSAGVEFTIRIASPQLFKVRPHISCVQLEENVCAHIRQGVPCHGSDLHKTNPNHKIPITITGFVPNDSVYKCRPPRYTPSLGNLPTTFSPIGKCCYIGHPDHILSEGACYTKKEHHLPFPNQNSQAPGSKRPLGPNADPEGPHAKELKYQY